MLANRGKPIRLPLPAGLIVYSIGPNIGIDFAKHDA